MLVKSQRGYEALYGEGLASVDYWLSQIESSHRDYNETGCDLDLEPSIRMIEYGKDDHAFIINRESFDRQLSALRETDPSRFEYERPKHIAPC